MDFSGLQQKQWFIHVFGLVREGSTLKVLTTVAGKVWFWPVALCWVPTTFSLSFQFPTSPLSLSPYGWNKDKKPEKCLKKDSLSLLTCSLWPYYSKCWWNHSSVCLYVFGGFVRPCYSYKKQDLCTWCITRVWPSLVFISAIAGVSLCDIKVLALAHWPNVPWNTT